MYVLKIQLLNRWYPKHEPEPGSWQKVRVKVKDYIQTDENFSTEYGQITLVGHMPCLIPGVDTKYTLNKRYMNVMVYNILFVIVGS